MEILQNKIKKITQNFNFKEVKISFWNAEQNLGDALNPIIMSKLFGLNASHENTQNAHLLAIGSWLQTAFIQKGFKAIYSKKLSQNKSALKVWGTGFMEEIDFRDFCLFRELEVYALRGKLSLEVLKNSQQDVWGGELAK